MNDRMISMENLRLISTVNAQCDSVGRHSFTSGVLYLLPSMHCFASPKDSRSIELTHATFLPPPTQYFCFALLVQMPQ